MQTPRKIIGLVLAAAGLLAVLAWLASDTRVWGLLVNTGKLAVAAAAIAVLLGTALAVAITKTNLPGRSLALGLLAAMLFLPLYIQAAAWDAGFGMQGWYTLASDPHLAREPLLAGWRAAIWIHAMAAVPWVVLIVAAGLRAVEPELEEDAALTAHAGKVLWHVSLRRSRAAILVAALWVGMTCAADITVTDLFQVRTFAEEIYTQAALGGLDPLPAEAAAQSGGATILLPAVQLTARGLWLGLLVSLVVAILALALARRFWPAMFDPAARPRWVARLGGSRWPLTMAAWLCLLLLAGVPIVNLLSKAGIDVTATETGRVRTWSLTKAMEMVAAAPAEHHRELTQSFGLAVAAAAAALVLGICLAWSLRDVRHTPWLRLLLIGFCLTTPGPLLGVGLIRVLNQPADSPWSWLAPLYDSLLAPWLVQTIRALPIATLVLWPALAAVPQATLDSAASEGAGRWRQLLTVALPQVPGAIAAAWLLGFAVAFGELAATVLVIPPGTTTISVRIFSLLHYGVEDRVASICLVLIVAMALLTIAAVALLGRGHQRQNIV